MHKFWFLLFLFPLVLLAQPKRVFKHVNNSIGLSQNSVYSILKDQQGFIWMSTENGLNRYDGDQFLTFYHSKDEKSISSDYSWPMYEDSAGYLWVGTANNGFNRYDKSTRNFNRYIDHSPKRFSFTKNNAIWHIESVGKNEIWVGTFGAGWKWVNTQKNKVIRQFYFKDSTTLCGNDVRAFKRLKNNKVALGTFDGGLSIYDKVTNTFEHIKQSPKKIVALHYDNKNTLWIGTHGNGLWKYTLTTKSLDKIEWVKPQFIRAICTHPINKNQLILGTWKDGLFIINFKTKNVENYKHDVSELSSLADDKIVSLYVDENNLLWIGTYNGGTDVLDLNRRRFKIINQNNSDLDILPGKTVTHIAQQNDNLWFCTNSAGLVKYNEKNAKKTYYNSTEKKEFRIKSDLNYFALPDKISDGTWIGSNKGIDFIHSTGKVIEWQSNTLTNEFSKKPITAGIVLKTGELFFTTYDGQFYKMNRQQKILENALQTEQERHLIKNHPIFALYEDNQSNLWLGSSGNGLFVKFKNDTKLRRFKCKLINHQTTILSITQDSYNRLWFATSDGLLVAQYKNKQWNFKLFNQNDGLPNNFCTSVLTCKNFLWVSTIKGLTQIKLCPHLHIMDQYNYTLNDGLPNIEFSNSCALKTKKNELYFGNVDGAVKVYQPTKLVHPKKDKLQLVRLEVLNSEVQIEPNLYEKNKIIQNKQKLIVGTDYTLLDTLFIPSKFNVIRVYYSNLNFTNKIRHYFRFKLNGLEEQWRVIPSINGFSGASYTNLNPGTYTLLIQTSNHPSQWDNVYKSLVIEVLPDWYQTWFFKITLLLFILTIIYIIISVNTKRYKLAALELERKVNQRTKDLAKTNYLLMDLSRYKERMSRMLVHDLKTPLLGIEEIIKEDNSLNARQIKSSTRMMLQLITNSIDFHQLSEAKLELNIQDSSIESIVNKSWNFVSINAALKNIVLNKQYNENIYLKCDHQLIERLLINLISNAIQYSPSNSIIEIKVESKKDKWKVSVSDQGKGLKQEEIDAILDKSSSLRNSKYAFSTGIGLDFCMQVLEAHDTTFSIENNREKDGCTFSFELPGKMETNKNQEISSKQHQTQLKPSYFAYNYYRPFIEELRSYSIYEGSKLLAILDKIELQDPSHQIWIDGLKHQIFAVEAEGFETLLKQMEP